MTAALTPGAVAALQRLAQFLAGQRREYIAEVIDHLSQGRMQRLDGMHVEDLEQRARDLYEAGKLLERAEPAAVGVSRNDVQLALAALVAEIQRSGAFALAARAVDEVAAEVAAEHGSQVPTLH